MKELAELLPQRGATWVQPAEFSVVYSDFERTPVDAWRKKFRGCFVKLMKMVVAL
jgi:hypothetical protein